MQQMYYGQNATRFASLPHCKVCNTEKISFLIVFASYFVSLQRNTSEHEENSINPFDNSNLFYGWMPAK